MNENGVLVFPDAGSRNNSSVDPALLLALGNGGFGGMNNPLWMMFMYPFIMPFMSMWMNNGFGGFGGFGGNAGTGYVANQLNNDVGRELIVQAINGRADALAQLAGMTNNSVENVRNAIATMSNKLYEVGAQVGMSGLEVINAVQAGNATIGRQLCECCCENRLAIANQTATLQAEAAANHSAEQAQLAAHDANVRLQIAELKGEDALAICKQTNELGSQSERNTNSILSAIQNQNAMLEQRFCEIKEREMQSKIDTQGDIITQLRGQISNDKQTETFNAAINALNEKIALLAAKQPNTVPVQYPNLVAANATPYVGQGYYPGFNGNGNIVF